MKLIRFGEVGSEKPGLLLDNNSRVDASTFGEDYNEAFFANDGLARLQAWADEHAAGAPVVAEDIRWAAPIARPGNIVCIGLNYTEHAVESKMEATDVPPVFFKASSAYSGPFDTVVIPLGSTKTDYEVELGIVLAKPLDGVTDENIFDYIAGYVIVNDYSEREQQLETSGQWCKGKSYNTFAPVGPVLVTKDEIDDVGNLNLWLKVNGETRQDLNTSHMISNVPNTVKMLSENMSLFAGDLISTGTPPGVGMGFDPPKYLSPGDVVEYGIDGLGVGRQTLAGS